MIKVTRTVTFVTTATWPDHYQDMTLNEALNYEANLNLEDIYDDTLFEGGHTMTVKVETSD